MKKDQFLKQDGVCAFVEKLSSLMRQNTPLARIKNENVRFLTLNGALEDYRWPPKTVRLHSPGGELCVPALSEFKDNQKVLDILGQGLSASLANGSTDEDVGNWVRCILQWGGVYAYSKNQQSGNKGWLETQINNKNLIKYLINFREKLLTNERDDIGLEIDDLRSNAGLTKVYSLLLPNFIIYDSRVAATLSWLVHNSHDLWKEPPIELRFSTMRAKTSKLQGKVRTADSKFFPYFAPSSDKNFQKHLFWNIRANWTLEAAISLVPSSNDTSIKNVRDLEAALFAIGDDLSFYFDQ